MATDTHARWICPVTHSAVGGDARRVDGPGGQAPWIAWVRDESQDRAQVAGSEKVAQGERIRGVVPMPRGFVVNPEAYLRALDRVGGRGALRFRVASADVDDPAALTRAANECQALVRSVGMPEAVRRAVLDAYARLGRDVPVVVRVSSTTEDGAPTSFAGTDKTFIDVRGGLQLIDSIVECWAWRWSPQVVAHRASHGLRTEPAMAVVVQPMVNARTYRAPVNGDPAHRLQPVAAGKLLSPQ
jgi:pyruvate, water dikinase